MIQTHGKSTYEIEIINLHFLIVWDFRHYIFTRTIGNLYTSYYYIKHIVILASYFKLYCSIIFPGFSVTLCVKSCCWNVNFSRKLFVSCLKKSRYLKLILKFLCWSSRIVIHVKIPFSIMFPFFYFPSLSIRPVKDLTANDRVLYMSYLLCFFPGLLVSFPTVC